MKPTRRQRREKRLHRQLRRASAATFRRLLAANPVQSQTVAEIVRILQDQNPDVDIAVSPDDPRVLVVTAKPPPGFTLSVPLKPKRRPNRADRRKR